MKKMCGWYLVASFLRRVGATVPYYRLQTRGEMRGMYGKTSVKGCYVGVDAKRHVGIGRRAFSMIMTNVVKS